MRKLWRAIRRALGLVPIGDTLTPRERRRMARKIHARYGG